MQNIVIIMLYYGIYQGIYWYITVYYQLRYTALKNNMLILKDPLGLLNQKGIGISIMECGAAWLVSA